MTLDLTAYRKELFAFMHSPPVAPAEQEAEFNRLALRLYAIQTSNNAIYHRVAAARGATNPLNWRQLPAIPTATFKDVDVTLLPASARTNVFHSSGTTEQRPSRHFHSPETLAFYEESLARAFTNACPEIQSLDWVFLTPPSGKAPYSSLAHMFSALANRHPKAEFFGHVTADGWVLNLPPLIERLRSATLPVFIAGTAFNFVHLLDALASIPLSLHLPHGSVALQTGGYKGRSRTLAQEDLYAALRTQLGITVIRSEYGMSELSSQAYDQPEIGNDRETIFKFPHWVRTRLAGAGSFTPSRTPEKPGLLEIIDLANVSSAVAIQTGDLAVEGGSGFTLLGRAEAAEPRGCSLQSSAL
ncbi:MAG TPA: hypothetical protein VEH27_15930 [Methylomirabilota bacterium]|nr:hypothetical protein [Methylomirabilota bacterium]